MQEEKLKIRIEELKKLISKGEFAKALRYVRKVDFLKKREKELVAIARQFNDLKNNERNQTISRENYNIELNKLTHAFLEIISEVGNTFEENKENNRKHITPIIALASILFVIVAFFLYNQFPKNRSNKTTITYSYPKTVDFKILILPFESFDFCSKKSISCELALQGRFNEIDENDKEINIKTEIYQPGYSTTKLYRESEAINIGESEKADLVIWGNYQVDKCEFDSTKIKLRWASVKENVPFEERTKSIDYQKVERLEEIESGIITGNIEEIVFWSVGLKFFNIERFNKALEYFTQIKKNRYSEYAILYYLIANSMRRLESKKEEPNRQNLEKAFSYSMIALELNPDDSIHYENANKMFYNVRGLLYLEYLKNHECAIEDFKNSLKYDSTSRTAYNAYKNLAATYIQKKEYQNGLPYINKALGFNEKNADNHRIKGLILLNIGYVRQAIEECSIALDYNPNCGLCYSLRGVLYHKQAKYQKAIDDCEKALELIPDDKNAYITRLLCYKALGTKVPPHESSKYFNNNKLFLRK